MCGIVGFWRSDGRPLDVRLLARTSGLLRHRGPDDEGFLLVDTTKPTVRSFGGPDTDPSLGLPELRKSDHRGADLAFGFRRLAILDPSSRGHQPMGSADGRSWIVFNGEVYNYLELRSELERSGHAFRTNTDTEVLLAAYAEWGRGCLGRLIGMWAFCIWDGTRRELFLARDPFGIKPLYYWHGAGCFAFASEIKALLEIPDVRRQVRAQRIYDYLRFGWTDHGGDTLFRDVHQIPPAHTLTLSIDQPEQARLERYWELAAERPCPYSRREAAARLRALLLKSVNLHLRSDVSVGSALSGGIDSSSILMGIRHVQPERASLRTCSHIDADPTLSEESWIDVVAEAAGARAYKVRPRPEELLTDMEELLRCQDEPFGSTSIYAQFRVFRLAREHGIKVMLDGQGGDELLGGYPSYLSARLASLIVAGHWIRAFRFLVQALRAPGVARSSTLVRTGGLLIPYSLEGLARSVSGESFVPSWMDPVWVERNGVVGTPLRPSRDRLVLREQLREAISERSLPSLLRYEDRNAMASSVESRVPFLTTEISELVFSLPEEYIIDSRATSKSILRDAMRGIVPDRILDRRDKIGFATSEQAWLDALRPAVQAVFDSEVAAAIPALKPEVIRAEAIAVSERRSPFDFRIWRWLNLIRWAERLSVSF